MEKHISSTSTSIEKRGACAAVVVPPTIYGVAGLLHCCRRDRKGMRARCTREGGGQRVRGRGKDGWSRSTHPCEQAAVHGVANMQLVEGDLSSILILCDGAVRLNVAVASDEEEGKGRLLPEARTPLMHLCLL